MTTGTEIAGASARPRIAVDVGGTFTDVILLLPDGRVASRKVLSSPPNFNDAIARGVAGILKDYGVAAPDVSEFSHGATVATNCILTRTGAVTALITTTGFRDVLEIRRMRMHKLYDIFWEKPKPMVPRHLRMEINARTDPKNGTESSLDEDEIEAIIDKLDVEGVQSVAICYLHSYASGANERRTRDILLNRHPSWFISISSEVLPEIKEYERTSTTVINAYVQPPVARYANAIQSDMQALGVSAPIIMMQSNGGMLPIELACRFPIRYYRKRSRRGRDGRGSICSAGRAEKCGDLRYGRDDSEGVDHRRWRNRPFSGIRSRRRHQYWPPHDEGQWVFATRALDRHRRGFGRRRKFCLDRCCRSLESRAWQRWRCFLGQHVTPRGARSRRLQTPMCTSDSHPPVASPAARSIFPRSSPSVQFSTISQARWDSIRSMLLGPFDRLLMQA